MAYLLGIQSSGLLEIICTVLLKPRSHTTQTCFSHRKIHQLLVIIVGYDLKSEEGYEKVKAEFDRVIGRKYLRAVHLNDSKG